MRGSMSFAEGDLYVVTGLRRILDFGQSAAGGDSIVLDIVTTVANALVSREAQDDVQKYSIPEESCTQKLPGTDIHVAS
jgi:hypothetical protein